MLHHIFYILYFSCTLTISIYIKEERYNKGRHNRAKHHGTLPVYLRETSHAWTVAMCNKA